MKQGTTYPLVITIKDVDLSNADWVIVSIKPQRRQIIEFNKDDLLISHTEVGTTLSFSLTQAQSLSLPIGATTIDVNWFLDGIRGGCEPCSINITETLLERVVENE